MPLTIGFLGVGSAIRTPYANVGTLLDGTLLVDAPPACAYFLRTLNAEPDDIDVVLITHLHGDHVFGLPLLLTESLARPRTRRIDVCGPLGIESVTRELLRLAWPDVAPEQILQAAAVEFTEWVPWSTVPVGSWQATPVPVTHGTLPAYGLRLERGAHRVFHTGDTGMAPTVTQEVASATLVVADVSSVRPRGSTHMSLVDLDGLRAAAPDVSIMAVHRDFAHPVREHLLFPEDGQLFEQAPGGRPELLA